MSEEDVAAIREGMRAHAIAMKRSYVTPEDVKFAAREVLRKRVVDRPALTHEDAGADAVVTRLFDAVEVP